MRAPRSLAHAPPAPGSYSTKRPHARTPRFLCAQWWLREGKGAGAGAGAGGGESARSCRTQLSTSTHPPAAPPAPTSAHPSAHTCHPAPSLLQERRRARKRCSQTSRGWWKPPSRAATPPYCATAKLGRGRRTQWWVHGGCGGCGRPAAAVAAAAAARRCKHAATSPGGPPCSAAVRNLGG